MTVQPFTGAQSHLPAVQSAQLPAHLAELRAWASTYAEVASFVGSLIDTPFIPAAFRPEAFAPRNERQTAEIMQRARETAIASGTAAVLFGAAIGFDPITALQNVYVVGGRPGLYAAAMVAILQAAGHEVWTEDISDSRAVVCGRRKGTDIVERVTVTMDQAKRANWTRNAKYQSEPQAMLWARAASTVCRRVAQDALHGIGAAVEELEDAEAVEQRPAARTVQRQAPAALPPAPAPAPAPAAVPEVVDSVLGDPEPAPAPAPDPARLWADINARFLDLGVTGPGKVANRLAVITSIVGRKITQGRELTVDEALLVLDNLAGDNGRRAIDDVLGNGHEKVAEPAPPQQEAPAPAATADPWGPQVPGDEYDPTTEDAWSDQGRPAVLDVPGDQQ